MINSATSSFARCWFHAIWKIFLVFIMTGSTSNTTHDNRLCFVKTVNASKNHHSRVTPKLSPWQEASVKRTDARVHLTRRHSISFLCIYPPSNYAFTRHMHSPPNYAFTRHMHSFTRLCIHPPSKEFHTNLWSSPVVLNRGYTYHLGVRGAKAECTKHQSLQGYTLWKFKPNLLNIHRDSL